MRLPAALALMIVLMPQAASSAGDDKFRISDQERSACTADAIRLCMNTYPNEDRLLSCMKTNRASLSPTCLAAFDAGVRRRHL